MIGSRFIGIIKSYYSYTLFGNGFGPRNSKNASDDEDDERDQNDNNEPVDADSEGVILRSVRDIFMNLTTHLSNRNFIMHIG